MEIKTPLGQRVKYFRNRAGISQSTLETEADLSFGTLSRIESGHINPTKESLLKIAEFLKLSNEEIIYLIYPEKLFVTQDEIRRAVENVKTFIDTSSSPVYILDNLRRVVYAGEAVLKLFGLTEDIIKQLSGIHILELVFNPSLPIRNLIPKEEFKKLGLSRIYAFQQDLKYLLDNNELDETLQKLNQFPDFKEFWEEAKMIKIDPYSKKERSFSILAGGKRYHFYFTNISLEIDKRFEIIEYHKI